MDKINNIINDLNEKIKAIKIVLNQNSLTDLTNEIINQKERETILNDLLNYYLKKLEHTYSKEKINDKYSLITEITEYFIDDSEDDLMLEEGSTIVYDFLEKLNSNDRKLTLPINIEYLKEYAINNKIDKENVIKEIVWMIILLATIYYCLNEKANS